MRTGVTKIVHEEFIKALQIKSSCQAVNDLRRPRR
jgi:hypothetical protein